MDFKLIRILGAVFLILSIFKLPIGYYTFLRIFIFIIALILVYKANKINEQIWLIGFLIIAILFNPIFPIYFKKDTWLIIDIITAIIFLTSIKFFNFTINANKNGE